MRKLVYALLVFILFSFVSVSAGESYDVDFTEIATQPVYLYQGDEVRFELLGGQHVLILNDVGEASVKLGLGPFIDKPNNTEVFETILGLDYILKLDLDKDGTGDLNVALYSIASDGQVHLVLQDIAGEQTVEDATGVDVGLVEQDSPFTTKTVSLIVIGVLILALVLFLVFRKGKKEASEEHKNKDTASEHKAHDHTSHDPTQHHASPKEDTS